MGGEYYDILGLTSTCSKEDIKRNYKKLALKWHPDRNRDNKDIAEAKFKKISEAYEVLSDDEKRQKYDRFGSVDGPDISFTNANDIFEQMFGQSGGFPFNIANLMRPQQQRNPMGSFNHSARVSHPMGQFMSFNMGMPNVIQQCTTQTITTNDCGQRVIRKQTKTTNPDGSVSIRIEEQIL